MKAILIDHHNIDILWSTIDIKFLIFSMKKYKI
jgi:hypothetical protein